jgi:ribosomal protein S16
MRDPQVGRWQRILLLSFLLLAVVAGAAAQQKARKKSRLDEPAQSNTSIQPQLLHADTNPTLRFPVARGSLTVSSLSYGWLDISHREIHYQVVQPADKAADGFSITMADMSGLKLEERNNTVTFRAGNKRELIFYVAPETWGTARGGRAFWALTSEGASGTQSIYKTLLDVDAMLALIKSQAPPPAPVLTAPVIAAPPAPQPAAPASPPAIVVAAPAGAAANQTVEVTESPLVVRGVAMDSGGIPQVSINGAPANLRPQNTQAAEFWSDPLPLQPGSTSVQIVASNSAHVQATFDFMVHYSPKAAPVNSRALDKAEVLSLLQGAVPTARVASIIKERGIKFTPTADDLRDIRAAGGDDEVVQALQQATPQP